MARIAQNSRKAFALGLAVFALSVFDFQQPPRAEHAETPLMIGGTGTALGGMRLLAQAFAEIHPEINTIVLPSLGSSGAIKALIADKIDLAISARPLKDTESAEGLKAFLYAKTPIIFATQKKTPVNDIELDQLPGIYSGAISTWPDGTPIRLIRRPEAETDTKLLRGLSDEMDKAVQIALKRTELYVAITDQNNAAALEKVPGSLGLTTLAQILSENRYLKQLRFNGKTATVESLRTGDYPYFKELYLVEKEPPSDAVKAFVSFLYSDTGRSILTSHGHDVIGADM